MAVAGFLYNRLKRYFAEFSERIHTTRSMNNTKDKQQPEDATKEKKCSEDSSTENELNWYLTLVKGPDTKHQMLAADDISVSEFNHDGSLFATGDKGGRIVIFQRKEDRKVGLFYYDAYVTFVSHEPEFDYLKSLEIEEKINKIKFLHNLYPSNYLLSTNDKTIKLWKIQEKHKRFENDYDCTKQNSDAIRLPKVLPLDSPIVDAHAKAIYKNGHTYHINSISLSSDGETFISSDDLRINLWHLNVQNQLYNIVDMKPANMEDITEVITSAECHPSACNLFAYTSSKGYVRLCDLRTSALCDQSYKLYEVKDDPSSRNFFSEIISSISDIRFDHTGQYMLTRDYMSLKVWDCRQQTGPIEQYFVHPHIKERLCVMYENDFIFDKFDCGWSSDDSHIVTGSYGNIFTVVDRKSGRLNSYCVSLDNAVAGSHKVDALPLQNHQAADQQLRNQAFFDEMDYSNRILHCSWSGGQNPCLAVAADCNVFFYSNTDPQKLFDLQEHQNTLRNSAEYRNDEESVPDDTFSETTAVHDDGVVNTIISSSLSL